MTRKGLSESSNNMAPPWLSLEKEENGRLGSVQGGRWELCSCKEEWNTEQRARLSEHRSWRRAEASWRAAPERAVLAGCRWPLCPGMGLSGAGGSRGSQKLQSRSKPPMRRSVGDG
jgi:hypothetical protein